MNLNKKSLVIGLWGLLLSIFMITPVKADHIDTIIGTGNNHGDAYGPVGISTIRSPLFVTFDEDSNIFVSDIDNDTIKTLEVDLPESVIFAGKLDTPGDDNGNALSSLFRRPTGLAFDDDDDLFIAMENSIRRLGAGNQVSLKAGSNDGTAGDVEDNGADARFDNPMGVAFDSNGDAYIVDRGNDKIKKVAVNGDVTDFANGFNNPAGIAIDSNDNIYVADSGNNVIKHITLAGVVTNFAGTGAAGTTDGDKDAVATFNNPFGVAVDSNDDIYVTDFDGHKLRKITIDSAEVSTVVGTGDKGFKDGDLATAVLDSPAGVAVDPNDDDIIIIADFGNRRVRRIDLTNDPEVISDDVVTIVGDGVGLQGAQQDGELARTHEPRGVAVAADGRVFFTQVEGRHSVRVFDPATGLTETLAGGNNGGFADGVGNAASFNSPFGVAFDEANNRLIIADTSNNRIRALDLATNEVSTLAGDGDAGFDDDDVSGASFNQPKDVAVLPNGDIVVADSGNLAVRRISGGAVSTIAASDEGADACIVGVVDCDGVNVIFGQPNGLDVDAAGNIFVADELLNVIFKIDTENTVTQLAGVNAFLQDNFIGSFAEGVGENAAFNRPRDIAVDPNNQNIAYISDKGNNRIRKIDLTTNAVTTVAGNGLQGARDGADEAAIFNFPSGISVAPDGSVVFADILGDKIRRVNNVTDIASNALGDANFAIEHLGGTGVSGDVDGALAEAQFNGARNPVFDEEGNLYFVDKFNHKIKKVDLAGQVTTLAGSVQGDQDGIGAAAQFNNPEGLAFFDGLLFVTDSGNNKVKTIDVDIGLVTTIAGSVEGDAVGDPITEAQFSNPEAIVVDFFGQIFIGDSSNAKIKAIIEGEVIEVAGSGIVGFHDGPGATAEFSSSISGLFLHPLFGVLIALDEGNSSIRFVFEGTVFTGAGQETQGSPLQSVADGVRFEAMMHAPSGNIALNPDTFEIFFTDTLNHRVRKTNVLTGEVVTVAGSGLPLNIEANAALGSFSSPKGAAFNPITGNLVVMADNVISSVNFNPVVIAPPAPPAPGPVGVIPTLNILTDLVATLEVGTDFLVEALATSNAGTDISNNINWSSNIQGDLVVGREFNLQNLVVGTHTITLNAPFGLNTSFVVEITEVAVQEVEGEIELLDDFTIQSANDLQILKVQSSDTFEEQGVTSAAAEANNIKLASNGKRKRVRLSATALDFTGGIAADLANEVTWTSDIDGLLATGPSLVLKKRGQLSRGTHTITVSSGELNIAFELEIGRAQAKRKNQNLTAEVVDGADNVLQTNEENQVSINVVSLNRVKRNGKKSKVLRFVASAFDFDEASDVSPLSVIDITEQVKWFACGTEISEGEAVKIRKKKVRKLCDKQGLEPALTVVTDDAQLDIAI